MQSIIVGTQKYVIKRTICNIKIIICIRSYELGGGGLTFWSALHPPTRNLNRDKYETIWTRRKIQIFLH